MTKIENRITFTRWLPGIYKANLGADCIGRELFANIKKTGSEWHAEIRCAANGEIVRFAGIWSSLKDAKDEVSHIIDNRN